MADKRHGVCPYCGGDESQERHTAKEMMFGIGGNFDYSECSNCHSLWLSSSAGDISGYYPPNYYSLESNKPSAVRRLVKRIRFLTQWRSASIISSTAQLVLGAERIAEWLSDSRVSEADAILDVGCGSGVLLSSLRDFGFSNLTGVDPYVQVERNEPGFRVIRGELSAASGKYRLVIFNHSLEHLESPRHALECALEKLSPAGELLVRIPAAGCWAWREYGVNWVQLDAPRHNTIPSERGLRTLAEALDCEVVKVRYDSTPFQFWASELYRKGVPLQGGRSATAVTVAQLGVDMKILAQRARKLNDEADGDQFVALLRKRG